MLSIDPFIQLLEQVNDLMLSQIKETLPRIEPVEPKNRSKLEDSHPILPYMSDNSLRESSKSLNYLYSVPNVLNAPLSRNGELLPWKKEENSLIKAHFARQIISQQKMAARRKQLKRQPFIHWNNVQEVSEDVTIKGKDGRTTYMHITGVDLLSLKNPGPMSERIIINYLNYLIASNIINSSVYIFPFAFISNLMNSQQSDTEISMQRFIANTKKNYDAMKSKIMVNIFDFDDVVVPIRNGNHFSSIIIHNLRSYEQRKTHPCLVYCDSKDIVIPDIVEAIRLFLQFELFERKSLIGQFTHQTLPFYQVMVPRQTNNFDSSLYMTLNIQTLLGKGSEELDNLKKPENRKKLHIYPRILALSMKQRIWNAFSNILKVKTNQMRLKMSNLLEEERKKIIKTNNDDDYDRINRKELRKYQVLHRLSHKVEGKQMDDENYANELQYYLDPNINYLENSLKEE